MNFYKRSLLLLLSFPFALLAQEATSNKIDGSLMQIFEDSPESFVPCYILLEDQLDVKAFTKRSEEQGLSLEQRAIGLNKALRQFSSEQQAGLLRTIEDMDAVLPSTVKGHWLVNLIYLEMKSEAALELSKNDQIAKIYKSSEPILEEGISLGEAPIMSLNTESTLFEINAHKLWELGYTGYGTTCLTADTGVDPSHPALMAQQRANVEAFFDASFYDSDDNEYSYDCGTHGTHVAGTVLGLDRVNDDTIGVAFNGQWLGAAILCGIGTMDNVETFEWAVDPDNNPNTVDDMPTVINNSWYDPSIDDSCFNIYVEALTAVEAMGIAVVFSAGNEGPSSSTITNPKNLNMGLVNTFAVGALSNDGSVVTNFSSRGPSQCFNLDSSLTIKPEVSAPGQAVRSAVPGGGYDFKSGTSMAAPHVAGAIMLLKEAFPDLSGETLKLALYYSAVDMGAPGEDNIYGMGIIDVFAAYQYLIDQGNTPSDPAVSTDLMLFGLESDNFLCEGSVSCSVWIENAGSEIVEGVSLSFTYASSSISMNMDTLVLEPGERYLVQVDSLSADLGRHMLEAEVNLLGDQQDSRPLNNRIIRLIENNSYFPSSFEVMADVICQGTSVSISGNVGNGEEGLFEWYADENLNDLIDRSSVLNIEMTEEEMTIYAKTVLEEVGGPSIDKANAVESSISKKGLILSVDRDLRLRSVHVDVVTAGLGIIQLLDDGEIVSSSAQNLSLGEQELILNFEMEEGKLYDLIFSISGASLKSHDYDLGFGNDDNTLTIFSSVDNGTAVFDRHFFFYDFKLVSDEPECNVQPIRLESMGQSSLGLVSFDLEQASFNLDQEEALVSPQMNFDGEYTEILWDFGDGETSTLEEPSHEYSSEGVYLLSLTIVDENGCSSQFTRLVEVNDFMVMNNADLILDEEYIRVYPNPSSAIFGVSVSGIDELSYQLLDINGRLLESSSVLRDTENLEIDLSKQAAGVYILKLSTDRGQRSVRLIKE